MHSQAFITSKLPKPDTQEEKKFDFAQFVRDSNLDTSEFIKDICDHHRLGRVCNFPANNRRTISLLSLKHFFMAKPEGQEDIIEHMSISKEPKYMELRGKHRVIYLDFADLANNLKKKISELYIQFSFVRDCLDTNEKKIFDSIIEMKSTQVELFSSLMRLIQYIKRDTKSKTILLIDNYEKALKLDENQRKAICRMLDMALKSEVTPLFFYIAMGYVNAKDESWIRYKLFPNNYLFYSTESIEYEKYFSTPCVPKAEEAPALAVSDKAPPENVAQVVPTETTENEPAVAAPNPFSMRLGT